MPKPYHLVVKDRYNFDKRLSGMIGVISKWNGKFVETGLAKFYDSVGIVDDIYSWERGTFV